MAYRTGGLLFFIYINSVWPVKECFFRLIKIITNFVICLSFMSEFSNFLPVTVVAAVVLFLLKEFIEGIRRYKGEVRKKKAIRAVIARECELNHWTIHSIRHILEKIRDEAEMDERTEFMFIFKRSGKALFRVKRTDDEIKSGSALGEVHREVMSKNLLDVAMFDKRLFAVLVTAYDAIAELQHVHDSLIYYIESQEEDEKMFLNSFCDYALIELEDVFEKLNKLYIECTGSELKKHRMR